MAGDERDRPKLMVTPESVMKLFQPQMTLPVAASTTKSPSSPRSYGSHWAAHACGDEMERIID